MIAKHLTSFDTSVQVEFSRIPYYKLAHKEQLIFVFVKPLLLAMPLIV